MQSFLRSSAVKFEMRDLSRTFLFIKTDGKIAGYISLAATVLEIKEDWPVSNQSKKRMNVLKDKPTVAFLIGQLCKADQVSDKIGPDMIEFAMKKFDDMRKIGAGTDVFKYQGP